MKALQIFCISLIGALTEGCVQTNLVNNEAIIIGLDIEPIDVHSERNAAIRPNSLPRGWPDSGNRTSFPGIFTSARYISRGCPSGGCAEANGI